VEGLFFLPAFHRPTIPPDFSLRGPSAEVEILGTRARENRPPQPLLPDFGHDELGITPEFAQAV
jgi:hypothetical protein